MRTYHYELKAGIPVKIDKVGNFVRCVKGDEKFIVTADNDGQAAELEFMQWWKRDTGFQSLTVLSAVDQSVDLKIGYGYFGDDRIGGAVDVNGLLSVVNAGGSSRAAGNVAVTAGVAIEVLPASLDRIAATVFFNVAGRLGFDNTVSASTGIPISAGSAWNDNNTAALWFYPLASGTVDYIEGLK